MMNVRKHRRTARGFGLLEVLVASTLLIMTVTGVFTANFSIMRARAHQVKLTQGTAIAEALMEQLLLAYTSHADLAAGNHSRDYNSVGAAMASASDYKADWTVTALSGAQNGMRRIDVRVSWSENGRQRAINLVSDR